MLRNHRDARRLIVAIVGAALIAVLGINTAHAALTTMSCVARKLKAHGKFQKCRAGEVAKILQGKFGDPDKCTAKLDAALAKLTEKAAAAAVACRYADNGNGSVTDYDTGLQWEKKGAAGGGPNYADPHDMDNTYRWSDFIKTDGTGFLEQLNGESGTGTSVNACFASHCDWRLPTILELQTILIEPYPCGTSPCIDPIFGPTATYDYWSSTTYVLDYTSAWSVYFGNGSLVTDIKYNTVIHARAVRPAM